MTEPLKPTFTHVISSPLKEFKVLDDKTSSIAKHALLKSSTDVDISVDSLVLESVKVIDPDTTPTATEVICAVGGNGIAEATSHLKSKDITHDPSNLNKALETTSAYFSKHAIDEEPIEFRLREEWFDAKRGYNTAAYAPTRYPGEKPYLYENTFIAGRSFETPSIRTFAVPTNEGLILLAAYYQHKFQTPIYICQSEDAFFKLFTDPPEPKSNTFGVIFTGEGLHVTPALCHITDKGKIQIFSLDSFELDRRTSISESITLLSSFKELEHFKYARKRQSDHYSCRTDALVILKDAMLDIREKKIDDLKGYIDPSTSDKTFELPRAWGRSVQKSEALPKNTSGVDTPLPGGKGKTLESHRETFRKKTKVTTRYYSTREKDGKFGGTTYWNETEIFSPNLYLNYKGKKNVFLVERLIKSPIKEVQEQAEALKKIFMTV